MAKKLGILALVVCMLLSVAAVASADWKDAKNGGAGPTQATTDLANPNGNFTDADNCEAAAALAALQKLGYKELESYTTSDGHLYALEDGSVIVNKATGKKEGNKVDETHVTLATWRETADHVSDLDKAFTWTPKTSKETVEGLEVDSENKVTKAEKGWKLTKPGDHALGQADIWTRTCILCGKKEEVIVATQHTPVLDKGQDYSTPPTCIKEGKAMGVVCSVCGNKNPNTEVTIPALGHEWVNKTVELSCTIKGGKGDICTRCGQVSADEEGHKYGSEDYKHEESAFAYTGDHPWVANVADKVLGHKWELKSTADINSAAGKVYKASGAEKLYVGTKPDCIADTHANHQLVYVCTRANCDKNLGSDNSLDIENHKEVGTSTQVTGTLSLTEGKVTLTVNAAEHLKNEDATYQKPTCVLMGRNSNFCAVCGMEIVEEVYKNAPATGHSPAGSPYHDNTTHGLDSMHYKYCTVCGEKVAVKCSDNNDDNHWVTPLTIEANCTTGKSTLFECKTCKYKENVPEKDSEKLPANKVTKLSDHYGYLVNGKSTSDENLAKWTTRKVTKAATCSDPGTAEYTCKDCGKVVCTKAIPGEHDFVMQSSELENCLQQWVEIWVCSREGCPGNTVKPTETGEETRNGVKLTWKATTSNAPDGKCMQRRIYTNKDGAHKFTTKKDVISEVTCAKDGKEWHICDLCGVKFGDPKHDGAPFTVTATGDHTYPAKATHVPADCTHPAREGIVCTVCGQAKPGEDLEEDKDSKPLGHNWANPTYYETEELAEAGNPDEAIEKPTSCSQEYWIRTVCTSCGESQVEKHKAGEHTWSKEAVHKGPNCELNDRNVFVCTVCGVEDDDGTNDYKGAKVVDNYQNAGGYGIADPSLAKTGHTYGDWTVTADPNGAVDATKHSRKCTVCGAEDPKSGTCHYTEDDDQHKDATCAYVEVTVMVCDTCKNSYTIYGTELNPDAHAFEDVPMEGYEPTCTEKGTVVETCPNCGATGRTKEVKALGHAWDRDTGDWTTGLVITQEPTCVADGVAHRECSICGFTTEDFTVGKYDGANTQFGHTWTRADYVWSGDQLIVDVEPTCTVDGTGHYVCADCGYELTTGIPHYDGASTPWGHTWNRPDYVWSIDQLTISTEPTCVADGEGYYECSDCGYKLVVPVPHYDGANTPYGHVWAHEAWPAGLVVNEDGTYYYQCSDCGYLFQEQ